MTTTHVTVIDRGVERTAEWLHDVMAETGWDDPQFAYQGLRATLHALRDRLPVDEVAHLGAQLPVIIRGVYYEGWKPAGKPLKLRSRAEFLVRIEHELPNPLLDAETVARAVFTMLARRVSSGEIEDVKHVLPEDIRGLWPRHEA